MGLPTERMAKYAHDIATALGLKMPPNEYQATKDFIGKYVSEFKKWQSGVKKLPNIPEPDLGPCDCGGVIRPIWYQDVEDGQTYLSHGTCEKCLKNIVVPGMTKKEFYQLK